MPIDFNLVPQSLKDRKQWVCWRFESRGGDKPTKVPVTIGGYGASSVDPADWYTYGDALEARYRFSGIGFVFAASDPYVGIDLDNCLLDGGEIADWAVEILQRFDGTYMEISPSGRGIKIICEGENPLAAGKRATVQGGAVEMYDRGRFFTITGDVWDVSPITPKQDAINWLASTYFPSRPLAAPPPTNLPPTGDAMAKAAAYLDTMEPSIAKQGGHAACFRAAVKMVVGFDLAPDQAYQLLASVFNPKCQPPWSEKELRHKVDSANKEAGQRGLLLIDTRSTEVPGVDLSGIFSPPKPLAKGDDSGIEDEDFAASQVPQSGLLREIFDYYCQVSHRKSNIMGLSVAVSLCETLFGRRLASHTDMRTNDYNVIIAPTNCGKEACEKTILNIIEAAKPDHDFLIPADVQSGNGLLRAIAQKKRALWVSDEFGKVLASILNEKNRSMHLVQVATHLLKLYGKSDSTYTGAAHSDGDRNHIIQPHLCVLGMTTSSTLFDKVDATSVHDGLFGRIAFWPVQSRPTRRRMSKAVPPQSLTDRVRDWLVWEPGGNLSSEYPSPPVIAMTGEALHRWEQHSDDIDDQMESEKETRAAIWGRVSGRAMKLAMVHFAARQTGQLDLINWELATIELEDVNWGIRVADWLAGVTCDLVSQNIHDAASLKNRGIIIDLLNQHGEVSTRDVLRTCRRMTSGELMAEAKELEAAGFLAIIKSPPEGRGRPSVSLRKMGGLE